MKIVIKGDHKEIAALVVAIQERQLENSEDDMERARKVLRDDLLEKAKLF